MEIMPKRHNLHSDKHIYENHFWFKQILSEQNIVNIVTWK